MFPMNRYIDRGSLAVMAITLVLFIAALFTKGLTHDLFLEAGVFLVSVKLILQAYRNSVSNERILQSINEIKMSLGCATGGRRTEVPPGNHDA